MCVTFFVTLVMTRKGDVISNIAEGQRWMFMEVCQRKSSKISVAAEDEKQILLRIDDVSVEINR